MQTLRAHCETFRCVLPKAKIARYCAKAIRSNLDGIRLWQTIVEHDQESITRVKLDVEGFQAYGIRYHDVFLFECMDLSTERKVFQLFGYDWFCETVDKIQCRFKRDKRRFVWSAATLCKHGIASVDPCATWVNILALVVAHKET